MRLWYNIMYVKMREKGGFFVDPKVKTGINAAQKGMQVVKIGKKALDAKKKLPGEKKKASLKMAGKAAKKAAKLALKAEKKQERKERNKKAVKNGKGIGRVALALWDRFF